MESTLAAVSSCRLLSITTRCLRSEVGVKPDKSSKGRLRVKLEATVNDDTPGSIEVEIHLIALGMPEGEQSEGRFAFKVDMRVASRFFRPPNLTLDLSKPDVQNYLVQPAYQYAVHAIRAAVVTMGYGNIQMGLDVRSQKMISSEEVPPRNKAKESELKVEPQKERQISRKKRA